MTVFQASGSGTWWRPARLVAPAAAIVTLVGNTLTLFPSADLVFPSALQLPQPITLRAR